MLRRARLLALACSPLVLGQAVAAQNSPGQAIPPQPTLPAPVVHPDRWPVAHSPVRRDPKTEARITALLSRMSVEEKVGQTLQPEMKSITPDDVRTYHIGSIENGGGSVPNGDKHAPVSAWLAKIDGYWKASVDPANKGVRIPIMWASDAVHGHNNVFRATLFPHNIGLGAARDADLVRRIGAATAVEVRVLGMDWSFAPTLAVVQDDRWGRTYESYSEDPSIVAQYATAMVEGLQGTGAQFLDKDHVISTAKHFLGDGGTDGGRDQGDNRASEEVLRDVHGAGYPAAVNGGVQSVMASFSSWQGQKLHASRGLLTDVLKDRIGFDGLVIGDWNAHGQVPGCAKGDCPAAFNAGVDVFNVPEDWKALYASMVREVKDGTIPMARLDDAVRRVLRVKMRAGVFDHGLPSSRPHAGNEALLGAPAHRAVAREAVAKSLVLLKNDTRVLPIDPRGHRIMVAGAGADSITKQTGGWTLSWQGNDNSNTDFPGATSIWGGIRAAVEAGGGTAVLSPDGRFTGPKPDGAIVVFGENPYAEFQGDQADVALHSENAETLAMLRQLRAAGVPTAAVLLSGRPLYLNPQINAADAFVAAWLPGSEGAGVADVLIARPGGSPARDFTGTLSFSWPRRPDQTPLNKGQANYDPQFAFGYGLSYARPARVGTLVEAAVAADTAAPGVFLKDGTGTNGFRLTIGDAQSPHIAAVGSRVATYGSEALTLRRVDRRRQEDAWAATWSGASRAWLALDRTAPVDLSREANGAMVLELELRVVRAAGGPVSLSVDGTALPIGGELARPSDWRVLRVPLRCFAQKGADLTKLNAIRIDSAQPLGLEMSGAALRETASGDHCPG
ncbi:glycoside hydrolase family 3 protein [Sphingomonas aerophila]|uniref:Beta-glucosidase n=1 Tax=Sphingomonas aerophila TaxID=1344948 RepID=A0A7W9BBY9_9SPHN|nr:beta-glucosidase [Sphingomonas aerophila]